METNQDGLRMPGEVAVALVVLVVMLAASAVVSLGIFSVERKMGEVVDGSQYLRIALSVCFGLAYVIGMAKGYGKFRWLLVAGLALSVLFLLFTAIAWLGGEGQMRAFMAFSTVATATVILLRILAIALLFHPVSCDWFDRKAAQRKGRPVGVADSGTAVP